MIADRTTNTFNTSKIANRAIAADSTSIATKVASLRISFRRSPTTSVVVAFASAEAPASIFATIPRIAACLRLRYQPNNPSKTAQIPRKMSNAGGVSVKNAFTGSIPPPILPTIPTDLKINVVIRLSPDYHAAKTLRIFPFLLHLNVA